MAMRTVCFKMVPIVFYFAFTTLRIHATRCSAQNEFFEFQKLIKNQTFSRQRLAGQDAKVFDREVFTTLQCLDICLRTEQCDSIDIKEAVTKKICRINRASRNNFLQNRKNWFHINIGTQALRKVSLHINAIHFKTVSFIIIVISTCKVFPNIFLCKKKYFWQSKYEKVLPITISISVCKLKLQNSIEIWCHWHGKPVLLRNENIFIMLAHRLLFDISLDRVKFVNYKTLIYTMKLFHRLSSHNLYRHKANRTAKFQIWNITFVYFVSA